MTDMDFHLEGDEPSFRRGRGLAHEVIAARLYGDDWSSGPGPRAMPHLSAAVSEMLNAYVADANATVTAGFCFVLARWTSLLVRMTAEDRNVPVEDVLAILFKADEGAT